MRLFFYGTLLDHDVRRAVLGAGAARLHGRRARLPGYRCVRMPGHSYPVLERDETAETPGAVFEGIGTREFDLLARYEGPEYTAAWLTVALANGPAVAARVFVPVVDVAPGQPDWRFEEWRRRHKARFVAGLKPGSADAGRADPGGR